MDATGIGELIGDVKTARVEVGPDDAPDNDLDEIPVITNDKTREEFDPSIHVATKDGLPVMNRDGSFRKKPGRKNPSISGHAEPRINIPEAPQPDQSEMAAKACAALYVQSGMTLFGMEWAPENKEEFQGLEFAFKSYFDAKGAIDIPPGIALALAMSSYAAKRFQQPTTQSRIAYAWGWLRGRFSRGKKTNATRDDIGSNGLRENNASAANGQARGWSWRSRSGT